MLDGAYTKFADEWNKKLYRKVKGKPCYGIGFLTNILHRKMKEQRTKDGVVRYH